MNYTLTEDDRKAIAELFVGRKIVDVNLEKVRIPGQDEFYFRHEPAQGTMTLDDGTVLYVIPNQGGCLCGAGDYFLDELRSTDNIITSARLDETNDGSYGGDAYTWELFVFTDNEQINAMTISGDDGNGYYGSGFRIQVVKP